MVEHFFYLELEVVLQEKAQFSQQWEIPRLLEIQLVKMEQIEMELTEAIRLFQGFITFK